MQIKADSPDSNDSEVDVLIVGAGPAGLALANWFRDSDLRIYLIDQKPGPTRRGQAEGLKSITVEIFESFGIGPQIWTESIRIEEIAIWGVNPDNSASGIVREQVIADKVEELGKTREMTLQQSRVEYHMLENILSSSNIKIQRSTQPSTLNVDQDLLQNPSAYPFTLEVEKASFTHDLKQEAPAYETNAQHQLNGTQSLRSIRARYIVGCDGARSWLRKQLGINLEGDRTDSVFGVVDIVPKTNFPDIRKCCFLKSPSGIIMTVPRANREIRLYIPVEKGSVLSDPQSLTFDTIMVAARKIIAPYTLEAASCSWWSAYRVGQRVGDRFSACHDRAFLAGDAVHTHSPKAGQGMNTSIQDSYNLGWKLRLVLQGYSPPSILSTYESERRPIAQDLIAFDKGYLKLFSNSSSTFDSQMVQGLKFTTGLSIRYPASLIVCVGEANVDGTLLQHLSPSELKADLVPGKRLPDFQVVYQADGRSTRIHTRLRATGQFRVLIFSGNITNPEIRSKVDSLGHWLADPDAGLGHLTDGGDGAKVDILLIHNAPLTSVDHLSLPSVLVPWNEQVGYDYYRVLADVESAHEGHGRAYERLQIDAQVGSCVVVRPDGYVGAVTDLHGINDIQAYFQKVFT